MQNKIKWKSKLFAYRYHDWCADRARRKYYKYWDYKYILKHNRHARRSFQIWMEAMGKIAEKASSTKEDEPT